MKAIGYVFQTFTISREYPLDFNTCKLVPSARDSRQHCQPHSCPRSDVAKYPRTGQGRTGLSTTSPSTGLDLNASPQGWLITRLGGW